MTDSDTELMAALYIGPNYEIACRPDWEDEPAEGWSRLYCYEEVAAGILRLIQERDCLREALKRYGHHESGPDGCRFNPCTCGLAAWLREEAPPECK